MFRCSPPLTGAAARCLPQVLDTVHTLFGDDRPFITIFAIDPQVVIKGIEHSLQGLFRDSSITGHDYLRNIVQLPFYLQSRALPKQALPAASVVRHESNNVVHESSSRMSVGGEGRRVWGVGLTGRGAWGVGRGAWGMGRAACVTAFILSGN